MRVLIAPDSFKGSMTATEICGIIAEELAARFPGWDLAALPMADGGEGTCAALAAATGGGFHTRTVTGPMGQPVEAEFALLGDGKTAVIEMAAASGLPLVPDGERDIFRATSRGTGELMLHALELGCRHIILGIGGSATNDGGAGVLAALGVRLLDSRGSVLPDGAGALAMLDRLDISGLDTRVGQTRITVACDVTNPLLGPNGAAYVFGPQKGARAGDLPVLDKNLARLGNLLEAAFGREVICLPGSGAAGGLGAALFALGGVRQPGFDLVAGLAGFDQALVGADLLITGEGQMNAQSLMGKVPCEAAKRGLALGIPAIAIVGSLAPDGAEAAALFRRVIPLMTPDMTVEEAMTNAGALLRRGVQSMVISEC